MELLYGLDELICGKQLEIPVCKKYSLMIIETSMLNKDYYECYCSSWFSVLYFMIKIILGDMFF